ncbi:hypothetical protein SPFM15_00170 [Salmonella phage SPFM15]|nr:hypothetical protein SPFM5_00165 [Salmonella phage SPFM5]VFR13794.1 hypothetical protein SPFM15_00170 [Salmonella phage SPFM15]
MKTPLRRIKDASNYRPDPDVMESVMEHWLALATWLRQEGNANLCYPSWTFRLNHLLEGWQPHEYGKRFQLNFRTRRHHSLTFVATVAGLKDMPNIATVWAFTGEVRKDGDKLDAEKPVDLKTRAIIRAFSE